MTNAIETNRSYMVNVYGTPHKIFVSETRVKNLISFSNPSDTPVRQYYCVHWLGKNRGMWIDENRLKSKIVD